MEVVSSVLIWPQESVDPIHLEGMLSEDFLGVSDEQLARWYHDVLRDPTSSHSSLRLRLLQEITVRGMTVAKLLEYTAQSAGSVLQ